MNDKYIIHFVSKTKNHMIKFIENQLQEKEMRDIIPSHGNILTALFENKGKPTMKEIAERIGKDKSTVTVLINKLIDLGYVNREKCEEDKRVVYITLTKKAMEIEGKYNEICMEVNKTAFGNFTPEEKYELLRLLKKLSSNFKKKNMLK